MPNLGMLGFRLPNPSKKLKGFATYTDNLSYFRLNFIPQGLP